MMKKTWIERVGCTLLGIGLGLFLHWQVAGPGPVEMFGQQIVTYREVGELENKRPANTNEAGLAYQEEGNGSTFRWDPKGQKWD